MCASLQNSATDNMIILYQAVCDASGFQCVLLEHRVCHVAVEHRVLSTFAFTRPANSCIRLLFALKCLSVCLSVRLSDCLSACLPVMLNPPLLLVETTQEGGNRRRLFVLALPSRILR